MRDRIERFVLLPFSMGCVSESSIAVENISNSTTTRTPEEEEEYADDEESLSDDENLKSPLGLFPVSKLQRLFKNLSQLFVYKDDEMEEEEEEEEDLGMEIGLPTDVKHITHIGIDGSATSIPSRGWDSLKSPDLSALPSVNFPSSAAFVMPNAAQNGQVDYQNELRA